MSCLSAVMSKAVLDRRLQRIVLAASPLRQTSYAGPHVEGVSRQRRRAAPRRIDGHSGSAHDARLADRTAREMGSAMPLSYKRSATGLLVRVVLGAVLELPQHQDGLDPGRGRPLMWADVVGVAVGDQPAADDTHSSDRYVESGTIGQHAKPPLRAGFLGRKQL